MGGDGFDSRYLLLKLIISRGTESLDVMSFFRQQQFVTYYFLI